MKAREAKRVVAAIAALKALNAEQDDLARLDLLRKARGVVDKLEVSQVNAARAAGSTWSEIGDVYGLTKQGAQQRFRQE